MSYAAIIAPIAVRKHPNADKLQLGVVAGHQVVVGLDVKDGQVGVFFPADGQLSHEMCLANRLYTESACAELCLNALFGESFGFFDVRRRVRAQKFRGEKSDGFWLPLDSLAWTGPVSPTVGVSFTELNGKTVCNKYETAATKAARAQAFTLKLRIVNVQFPKHVDSEQLRAAVESIPKGSIVYMTEKLHGTSGRYGHLQEKLRRTWWQRLLSRPEPREWHHFNGSRNVTLERSVGEGFYGTNAFRYAMTTNLSLHKGEIVYFELVGDVKPGQPIMSPQPVKEKELRKEFGDTMRYRYGCPDGVCRLYVYRITRLNEDGVVTELPHYAMAARAKELGLNVVPTITGPLVVGEDGFYTAANIRSVADHHIEGVSTLDVSHIREGVVVRVEQPDGLVRFLKHKSHTFGVLEGYIKDDDSVVDLEEAA